jgi:hypothetical protein
MPIPENEDLKNKRKATPNYQHDIDLCNTYTMSFKNTMIDVISWKVVNIPLTGELGE